MHTQLIFAYRDEIVMCEFCESKKPKKNRSTNQSFENLKTEKNKKRIRNTVEPWRQIESHLLARNHAESRTIALACSRVKPSWLL